MTTAVRWTVLVVLVVHGLIHLLGMTRGFSPGRAVLWLLAAVLVLTAAALVALGSTHWWWVSLAAAVVSQAALFTSWSDARAGTAGNVALLLVAVYGFLSLGPVSLDAQWHRNADAALASVDRTTHVITEAEVARLPGPVADYVRASGAVGTPHVTSLQATVHGRIRGGPDQPWMPFTGRQVNTFGRSPQRVFGIEATMRGLPVDVLHVYDDHGATMQGRLLSAVPVLDGAGPEMDRSETVTLFNDLVVLAPAALVDAPVEWTVLDDGLVRGTYTAHGLSVTADLRFEGDRLVDFVSHDRFRASSDGHSFALQPWSTPLDRYADLHGHRLAVEGHGRWDAPAPEGPFTYIDFVVDDLVYDGASG